MHQDLKQELNNPTLVCLVEWIDACIAEKCHAINTATSKMASANGRKAMIAHSIMDLVNEKETFKVVRDKVIELSVHNQLQEAITDMQEAADNA